MMARIYNPYDEDDSPELLIIAIGGAQRAGKGETIKDLKEMLGSGWHVASTSDLIIYETAALLTYWTGNPVDPDRIFKNKSSYRRLLQHVGEIMEERERARLMKSTIFKAMLLGHNKLIIDSIRRESEVKYLAKLKAQFILVDAAEEVRSWREGGVVNASHVSETEGVNALRKHRNTYIIKNEKTRLDLAKEVTRFVEIYCRKRGPF